MKIPLSAFHFPNHSYIINLSFLLSSFFSANKFVQASFILTNRAKQNNNTSPSTWHPLKIVFLSSSVKCYSTHHSCNCKFLKARQSSPGSSHMPFPKSYWSSMRQYAVALWYSACILWLLPDSLTFWSLCLLLCGYLNLGSIFLYSFVLKKLPTLFNWQHSSPGIPPPGHSAERSLWSPP